MTDEPEKRILHCPGSADHVRHQWVGRVGRFDCPGRGPLAVTVLEELREIRLSRAAARIELRIVELIKAKQPSGSIGIVAEPEVKIIQAKIDGLIEAWQIVTGVTWGVPEAHSPGAHDDQHREF